MKVEIVSGQKRFNGFAPDGAPSMNADFARIMLGCSCYVVRDDGKRGRSIDPQWVRIGGDWIVGDPKNIDDTESRREAERRWAAAFAPCEALASRDPGRAT